MAIRKLSHSAARQQIVKLLASAPRALKFVDGALAGDAAVAASLIIAAHNKDRGKIAQFLWRAAIPPMALRAVLEIAWMHDHAWTWNAFGPISLANAFRDAAFPTNHLPATMDVWRGEEGDENPGMSWTLNRDVACWFAFRFNLGRPRLLKCRIERKTVLAHFTDRDEDEIVLGLECHGAAKIDGAEADWLAGAARRRTR